MERHFEQPRLSCTDGLQNIFQNISKKYSKNIPAQMVFAKNIPTEKKTTPVTCRLKKFFLGAICNINLWITRIKERSSWNLWKSECIVKIIVKIFFVEKQYGRVAVAFLVSKPFVQSRNMLDFSPNPRPQKGEFI